MIRRSMLVAALLAAALGVPGVGLAQDRSSSPTPSRLPTGQRHQVTLLTGDVVTVRTSAGNPTGCPTVTVRPARPSGVQHRRCGPDGRMHVIPAEVARLVGTVLDPALFDVTTLIRNGYDDGRSADLPLIVRDSAPARSAATSGLTAERPLPSIGATAGRQPKAKGPDLIRALSTPAGARATGAGPTVLLDRRVRASRAPAGNAGTGRLDHNLTQVSAPQAWASGATGQGARVAVLDTGADFDHPDLAGQVVERADFSVTGGDAVDRHGHGTHVAATIAGSGAAARGERRGVAPGASLLVGKVLGDDGTASESQVIAGMQWAAPRAEVVNLSLGGFDPSDGTDPLSLALDALSAQHGTLFVVAAGNAGPGDGSISAPAAAASALTVGAVDGADNLAEFSSRGPLRTRAAKPEIVAPGVDVVAARAAGTSMGRPVDARYTAVSGTSMASPHVAGAAALLVQRHPDWSANRLKAALVGAADPKPGADPYSYGNGRLNAAHGLSGPVATEGVVSLGTLTHPQTGTAEAKLGFANPTGAPVTLVLDVHAVDRHGTPTPSGAVRVSGGQLTLPAGGDGSATLHLDRAPFAGRPGLHTAVVTARTAAGVSLTRTLVTFHVEPPTFELSITPTFGGMPDGHTLWTRGRVVNLDDPALYEAGLYIDGGETRVLRVPAGRYSVLASVDAQTADGALLRTALVGDPDVTVAADTAVSLDGALAKPVTATVDGVPTTSQSVLLTALQRPRRGGLWYWDFAAAWGEDARRGVVYAAPMDGVGADGGALEVYGGFSLVAPGDEPSPYLYDLIKAYGNGVPRDPGYRLTAAERAALVRIDQRFNRLDAPDSTTAHKRYGLRADGAYLLEADTDAVPADRVDYLTPGYRWTDEAFYGGIASQGYPTVTQEASRLYAPGSRHEKVWVRQPLRPDFYDDTAHSGSSCAPPPPSRTRGTISIDLTDLVDAHDRFDCLFGDPQWMDGTDTKLSLYRNGALVGERELPSARFDVPQQAGRYRVRYDLDASRVLPVSTRVRTDWTFRSAGPSGSGSVPLPLLSVDYALPLDAANHPTGGTATFDVRQARGVASQEIRSFALWTSLDDGATWRPVPVQRTAAGRYTAPLPAPGAGQAVSLRVRVEASADSAVEQTIVRAYRSPA